MAHKASMRLRRFGVLSLQWLRLRLFVIASDSAGQCLAVRADIVVLFDDFWDCSSCVGPSGRNCSALDCMQWSPAAGACLSAATRLACLARWPIP